MPRLLLTLSAALLALLALAPAAQAAWIWPLRGEVITAYRNGDDPYAAGQHRGIDIAGPVGASVVAAAGGEVRFAGTVGSSGLTVGVRTRDGFDTSYLHLSSVSVRAGERVTAGERLGAVGTSGSRSASEPHLHFGVREAGSDHAYRNPLDFLPAPPGGPRQSPDPTPLPAPRLVPLVPAPEPVAAPAPRAVPAPGRIPAARPVPVPRPVPAPRSAPTPRVPAHRGAPAPAAVPSPHHAPVARHAPAGRPAPWEAPSPSRSPAGGQVPSGAGEGPHARSSIEDLGPGLSPLGSGAELRATAGRRARVGTAMAGPAPGGARTQSDSPGPDIGMVLACAGLLIAAGLLGGTGEGRAATARARDGAGRMLRPLFGRG